MSSTSKQLSQKELEEIYDFAVELARKAGEILLDGVRKRMLGGEERGGKQEEKEKLNAVDIVTQTDLGAVISIYNEGRGTKGRS
jgi:myo-inositol-1(or 4)-monophosphatase